VFHELSIRRSRIKKNEGREEEFNKRERSPIGHIDIWFCLHSIKDDDFWGIKVEIMMSAIVSRRHGKIQIMRVC
jgi:hypothetical protein